MGVERVLADAKSRGDREGFVRVLLGTAAFICVQLQERADGQVSRLSYPFCAGDGREYTAVHTRGELRPRHPGVVAQALDLPALSKGKRGSGGRPR
jgi:hypothetical protein